MDKDLKYEAAFKELQEIVADLQGETVSIDDLSEKAKRAAFLIKHCREKLKSTATEIDLLF